MNNQQILQKAIDKAWDNGYRPFWWKSWEKKRKVLPHLSEFFYLTNGDYDWNPEDYGYYQQIIFDHSFAKALWGEEPGYEIPENFGSVLPSTGTNWQFHLQEMVIAEDPIQYLGEHLGD